MTCIATYCMICSQHWPGIYSFPYRFGCGDKSNTNGTHYNKFDWSWMYVSTTCIIGKWNPLQVNWNMTHIMHIYVHLARL